MAISLAKLAEHIGAQLHGDGALMISSIATLSRATDGQISFLANTKYRSQLAESSASAVILHPDELPHCQSAALVMDNPYVGFAKVAQLLDTTPVAAESIAPTAVIAADVQLGEQVAIGANAVIESGVVLGDQVQIGPGCFVGKNTRIGARTKLWANVTIYHGVTIGQDCLLQSGAVIGADGFGYANDKGKWIKIPQMGGVVLGDRVEIGASTTVDRGAIEDTVLHDGVIIDNQCQIAHNVIIGENSAMAGCSVIGGSTRVGRQCTIAGMVAINGHIEIVDNVHITGTSMVTKAITEPGIYSSGIPATTNKQWRRNAVAMRNIDSMNQRIKALEKANR
ncbi:UDP-3-O-(3-hydroxymyristoyl)glucosamine N-acyltransferase [Neptunicella sp. SCSIO 80796]|uniref:UDP-3-O-(3-hydroxymyristoyl)glucosamine N-acyltransferase n=1 Tax=Neptunicella plasticusilytica TaxID=3117012 RepID=UPI003A4D31C7